MRAVVPLVERPAFSAAAVSCRDDHAGWSPAERQDRYGVVLVRRGRFRRRAEGVVVDADRTVGYLTLPGDEQHFAHPHGGDVCTWIGLGPKLWRDLAGAGGRPANHAVYVDARLDLAHRRFLAAAARDADFAAAEELVRLLPLALTHAGLGPVPIRSRPGDRALVAAARDALLAGDPAADGLIPLAQLLGVSPYRLSRAFSREVGISLTRYRNRVRVGRALDRLEGGDTDLATLAADLGFADQAHLTRTLRQHLGHPPTAVRRLLRP